MMKKSLTVYLPLQNDKSTLHSSILVLLSPFENCKQYLGNYNWNSSICISYFVTKDAYLLRLFLLHIFGLKSQKTTRNINNDYFNILNSINSNCSQNIGRYFVVLMDTWSKIKWPEASIKIRSNFNQFKWIQYI
jgi:hypothetical protein